MKRRLLAFLIDYLIIITYALILTGVTLLSYSLLNLEVRISSPIVAQLVGFFTLTLPVFLFLYTSEKGKYQATPGKRIQKLRVVPLNGQRANVALRNIVKLLPWEIAHTGVHWIMFYSRTEINPPWWLWVLLILPQLAVVMYLVTVLLSGGRSSIYDKIAYTEIQFD